MQPEARCLCGTPAADHIPFRYWLTAWVQHRIAYGIRRRTNK